MARLKPFILCFEAHRTDGQVWAVKYGRSWQLAKTVRLEVPVETVYLGLTCRQPRAFLTGLGVISRDGDHLVIATR